MKHHGHLEHRAVGDLVSATIDGKVGYWTNEYEGPGVATSASAGTTPANSMSSAPALAVIPQFPSSAPSPSLVVSSVVPAFSSVSSTVLPAYSAQTTVANVASSSSSAASSLPTASSSSASIGSWSRQAYYNAGQGTSTGFTFLNHNGGEPGCSGTADGGIALVFRM